MLAKKSDLKRLFEILLLKKRFFLEYSDLMNYYHATVLRFYNKDGDYMIYICMYKM